MVVFVTAAAITTLVVKVRKRRQQKKEEKFNHKYQSITQSLIGGEEEYGYEYGHGHGYGRDDEEEGVIDDCENLPNIRNDRSNELQISCYK